MLYFLVFFLIYSLFANSYPIDTITLKKIEIKSNRFKKIYGSKRVNKSVLCPLIFPNENDGYRSVGIKIKSKKHAVKRLIKLSFYLLNESLIADTLNISFMNNSKIECHYTIGNLTLKKGWNTFDLSDEKIFIDNVSILLLRFKSLENQITLLGSFIPKGNILFDSNKNEFYEFKFGTAAFYIETLEWN